MPVIVKRRLTCSSAIWDVLLAESTLTVGDEHNISVVEAFLLHQPQRFVHRRAKIRTAVKKCLSRTQLILHRCLLWKKQVRLKSAGAGEVNKGKFAPLALRNIQQRQRNGFAPCGAFAGGGAGFIEAADDIARALIDGLTAAILFDLPALILSQEQWQCLRCRQHGKLRGQRAGEVAAKLQRILFATAVGVSVPLSLREYFSKAAKIFETFRRLSLARTRSKRARFSGVLWRFPGSSAPRADDALHLLSSFGRGRQGMMDDTDLHLLALHRAVVDELGDRLHLPTLAFRFIGSFYHVPVQRGIVRMGGIILLQQFREPLCRSFLRLFQLFQRIQRAFFQPS